MGSALDVFANFDWANLNDLSKRMS